MSLNPEPFELMKSGRKAIEVRLFDEKRRKISLNDTILFAKLPEKNERLAVSVIGISIFPSFRNLLSSFDNGKFGHSKEATLEERIGMQRVHYTEDEEKEYGVVGIHIKPLDKIPGELL